MPTVETVAIEILARNLAQQQLAEAQKQTEALGDTAVRTSEKTAKASEKNSELFARFGKDARFALMEVASASDQMFKTLGGGSKEIETIGNALSSVMRGFMMGGLPGGLFAAISVGVSELAKAFVGVDEAAKKAAEATQNAFTTAMENAAAKVSGLRGEITNLLIAAEGNDPGREAIKRDIEERAKRAESLRSIAGGRFTPSGESYIEREKSIEDQRRDAETAAKVAEIELRQAQKQLDLYNKRKLAQDFAAASAKQFADQQERAAKAIDEQRKWLAQVAESQKYAAPNLDQLDIFTGSGVFSDTIDNAFAAYGAIDDGARSIARDLVEIDDIINKIVDPDRGRTRVSADEWEAIAAKAGIGGFSSDNAATLFGGLSSSGDMSTWASTLGTAIGGPLGTVAGSIIGQAVSESVGKLFSSIPGGKAGDFVQGKLPGAATAGLGASMGLVAGGPIGALAAPIVAGGFLASTLVDLGTKTQAFARIQGAADRVFDRFVTLLEPATGLVDEFVGILDFAVTAILKTLGPILKPLINDGFELLARGLYGAVEAVLRFQQGVTYVAWQLGQAIINITEPIFGFNDSLHSFVDGAISANATASDSLRDFLNMTDVDFALLGRETASVTEQMAMLADSMTNIPKWYRTSAYAAGPAGGRGLGPMGTSNQTIFNVYVNAADAKDMFIKIEQEARKRNYATTGTVSRTGGWTGKG